MAAEQKILVVGGGPVGALAALYAARRGHQVELYDLRDDPNFGDPSTRPAIALIPLQLSERGIRAIANIGVPGLIEDIMDHSIPIHTRMIHDVDKDGETKLVQMPYGPNGEVLHTLPREKIAKRLLYALQKEPTAKVIFNHKLITCNLEKKTATFEHLNWKERYAYDEEPADDRAVNHTSPVDSLNMKTVSYDFIMGCDGSYSNLRHCMMRQIDMDFQTSYIHAKWCDFIIPTSDDGDYRLNPKSLHVWPDKESMFIAQPSFDGSFRAGMVLSSEASDDLSSNPEKIVTWFRQRYPGIIPELISPHVVTRQFLSHQHISLGSVKCGTFGYQDSAVLLGDSSHAMTPFHAMGMITGLEDVRIFFEDFIDPAHRVPTCVEKTAKSFCPTGVIQRYTEFRRPDVQAMTDMAEEHYYELRIGSKSRVKRTTKAVQSFLQKHLPALGVATMYSRIQFSHERFTSIRKREERQKKIVKFALPGLSLVGFLAFISLFVQWRSRFGAMSILCYLVPNGN